MKSIGAAQLIVQKEVKVNPRYIVVNESVGQIEYRQTGQDVHEVLEKGVRRPVVWNNRDYKRSIQVRMLDYEWSSDINIRQRMQQVIQIGGDNVENVYLWIDVREDQEIIFVIVRDSRQVGAGYMVHNMLDIQVAIKQRDCQKQGKVVESNQKLEFGWTDLEIQDKQIEIEMAGNVVQIQADLVENKVKSQVDGVEVIVYVKLEGLTKHVIVVKEEDYKQYKIEQKKGNNVVREVIVKIPQLGVSVIDNIDTENSYELFYMYLSGLEYCLSEKVEDKTIQLRVQYMNLDHNKYQHCQYPVIVTSCNNKQMMEKQQRYSLDVCVRQQNQDVDSLIQVFKFIKVDFQSVVLRVEYFLVSNIIQFYTKLKEMQKTDQDGETQVGEQLDRIEMDWKIIKLTIQKSQRFIKELSISPLKLQFSFQFNKKREKQSKSEEREEDQNSIGYQLSQQIISKLQNFIIISNIEDGRLEFDEIALNNQSDNDKQLFKKIIEHYKDSLFYQVLKLVGSLDLIGNPIGLISNVGIGVKDVIVKPIEGLADGPLEMGKGLIEGTNSLVSNTVGGTFSSINKISKSMAQGVSTLAMDPEFLEQREQLRQKKAKGISDSLQQASLGLFQVFEQSMTGLVTKPIQGGKERGVTGFIEGSAKSVLGIVLNPITGIFDAISKTAEGIQNEFVNQDELPNCKRQRPIRAFYTYSRVFKQYSQEQAQTALVLKNFRNGRYSDQIYFDSYVIRQNSNVVIFMSDGLLCIDLNEKCRIWSIPIQNISMLDVKCQGVVIYLNKYVKVGGRKLKIIEIKVKEKEFIQKTVDNVRLLQELMKEKKVDKSN